MSSVVQAAHFTQIDEEPASDLTRTVKEAFGKALNHESDIDPDVLNMVGMSGRKYRHFINNLIRGLRDPNYLEIGCWMGSTPCSAISRNRVRATGIDNWSEFGAPKDQFIANLARFKTPLAHVNFVEADFRKVDLASLGTFNVYLFDGPHSDKDQYDGLVLAASALTREFILIVDDWNWEPVRRGSLSGIRALNLSLKYSLEIRTTLDGTHGPVMGQLGDWHNGYFISVLEKP
jgi:hypothetical protein